MQRKMQREEWVSTAREHFRIRTEQQENLKSNCPNCGASILAELLYAAYNDFAMPSLAR